MKTIPAFLIKTYIKLAIELLWKAQEGGSALGALARALAAAAVKADSSLYGRKWYSTDEALLVVRDALYAMKDLVPPGRLGAKEFKKLCREASFCLSWSWRSQVVSRGFPFCPNAPAGREMQGSFRVWPTLH